MSAQGDKLRRELGQVVAGVTRELGDKLVEKLRERTPVRTGYTRSRWTTTTDGQAVEVDNDQAEVIARLNDGSSRQAPAGFIEQAIDETLVEAAVAAGKPVSV